MARHAPPRFRSSTTPEPHRELELTDFHVERARRGQGRRAVAVRPDLEFPLPVDKIIYTHPGPADRPHLADGR